MMPRFVVKKLQLWVGAAILSPHPTLREAFDTREGWHLNEASRIWLFKGPQDY